MRKSIFTLIFVSTFLFINNVCFAKVCLKNDTVSDHSFRGVKINGMLTSHDINVGDMFVLPIYQPSITVCINISCYTFDNNGQALENGDMIHIGGPLNRYDGFYVSRIEKGNCEGRAPTF